MEKIKKPTTSKVINFIVAIIILGLVIFVSSTFKDMDQKIKVQHIEIQDKAKSVDNLKNKLEKINSELKDTKSSDSESKKRVEQLEKEKQELQSQLQARKEQKEKLARAAEISQQASAKSVPAQAPTKSAQATEPASSISSNKQDLMAQAGIPQSDWKYVDSIISRESGWRHTIWNSTGSGAYGLCQALPGMKMISAGADWRTNPVTQLKWCHRYAISRYESWANAYSFWNAKHWW